MATLLSVNINDETEEVFRRWEERGVPRANALAAGVEVLALLEDAVEVRLVDKDGTVEHLL